MKGTLHMTDHGWVVKYILYERYPPGEAGHQITQTLPLHPKDVKQINADAQVFDNIEARIAAYPDVEFEIVKENVDTGALEAPYIRVEYAKLKQKKISD